MVLPAPSQPSSMMVIGWASIAKAGEVEEPAASSVVAAMLLPFFCFLPVGAAFSGATFVDERRKPMGYRDLLLSKRSSDG